MANTDLSAALATAQDLAREAGRLQMRERATVTVHGSKAHANDLVSDVDLASERLIVDGLHAAFPADGLLAEEGSNSTGTSGRRWIVDPLDGTRNYLTGAGPWSVCIALQDGDDTVVAVVHDPAVPETFTAVRGAGAALDGEPLVASECARLAEAIVGLSFNPSPEVKRVMAEVVSGLLPAVGDIRRIPAALHLAYLAAGRFDAGILLRTNLWDIAAGLLLAAEAGVVLSGPDGFPTPELTVAAAPALWPEFSATVVLPRPT
ncbi:MAG TPA: inositol monophosphatase family protein [Actinoplanes sp.]|nr:inositol monophosphatase family protein [Actinoplanes sp.]